MNLATIQKLTDKELLEQVELRNKAALIELYKRYSKILYTLIKKITGNEEIASALLEEVFLIIWKKTPILLDEADSPYSMFIALARNRAVDSVRRNRNSLSASSYYDNEYEDKFIIPIISKEIDSIDISTAEKLLPMFKTALNNLTDAQKYVLYLAYYDGLTLEEIAQKLKIPIQTVRSKMKTAIYNLRDNLLSVE